jgi:hypothetical protein
MILKHYLLLLRLNRALGIYVRGIRRLSRGLLSLLEDLLVGLLGLEELVLEEVGV